VGEGGARGQHQDRLTPRRAAGAGRVAGVRIATGGAT
jgi:hypothetical protein